jgi:hypothetical protein
MFPRVAIVSVLASLTCFPLVTRAETCTPLPLVGGQGSEVSKTVSQPTIPGPLPGVNLTHNNWNTDWVVPTTRKFKNFVATITADNSGAFDIKMYLKYSDDTADEFFNTQGVQIPSERPLRITATPRPEEQPYQVNLFVGGLNRIGNSYKASVVGCF